MLRTAIIFSFICICLFPVYGQQASIDSLMVSMQKDQLLFEKVFLHTNKTSYFNEDTIWFKAYVSDHTSKPSTQTSLLYVSLFSSSGEHIETKDVLIRDGVGVGEFELSVALRGGDYIIQARTNYMRNFGDDHVFIKKINVYDIGESKMETTSKAKYDIQLFPEGGYLLTGVKNTLGIKALINGRGYDYLGKIVDSKNNTVVSFKSEHLGMSRCEFDYKDSEVYQAIFNINDTIIKRHLPKPKLKGLAIHINNTKEETLNLRLKTNQDTDLKLASTYTILFHQKNKLIDFFNINVVDTTAIHLEIDKSNFLNGVNTVTVFKNETPILERHFFIEKENSLSDISIKKIGKTKDSLHYEIQLKDNEQNANMSVSVLSGEMLSYDDPTNIESAFLLTPYLKGYIESPSYYFNRKHKNRLKHLDLLMLTQGWTQYTTQEYIEEMNPKYQYDFELGFKLNGTVSPVVSNNLGLLSDNNRVVARTFLNNKTRFSFKNLLVYKRDTIKVSFLKGIDIVEAIKPKNIYFDTIVKQKLDLKYSFETLFFKPKKTIVLDKDDKTLFEEEKSSDFRDVTSLETVNIAGKKKSKKFLRMKEFNNKYRKYHFFIGLYDEVEIPEVYVNKDVDLLTFFYDALKVRGLEYRGLFMPFFVDGKQVTRDEARGIRMSDVEAMASKRDRRNVSFIFFTNSNYKNKIREPFKKHIFKQGYDKAKVYYTPLYFNDLDHPFEEVDWKPIVKTDAQGNVIFKVKNNYSDTSFFIIQGITNDGRLINRTIKEQSILTY